MNTGKQKCETLKVIRKRIAEQYGLVYNPTTCTHEGDCFGTCPKCDAELQELQRQLDEKGIKDVDLRLDEQICIEMEQEEDDSSSEGDVIELEGDVHITRGLLMPPFLDDDIVVGEPSEPNIYRR